MSAHAIIILVSFCVCRGAECHSWQGHPHAQTQLPNSSIKSLRRQNQSCLRNRSQGDEKAVNLAERPPSPSPSAWMPPASPETGTQYGKEGQAEEVGPWTWAFHTPSQEAECEHMQLR